MDFKYEGGGIGKGETRHGFGRDYAIAIDRNVAVQTDELTLPHVKAPSARKAALGEDDAFGTGRGKFWPPP
jgi:hypothetical protein